jgi:hypothetical protein
LKALVRPTKPKEGDDDRGKSQQDERVRDMPKEKTTLLPLNNINRRTPTKKARIKPIRTKA